MTDDKRHLQLVEEHDSAPRADVPVRDAQRLARGGDRAIEATAAEHRGVSGEMTGELDTLGLMQVGELARTTGKTVRAIHLYESLGLIEPMRRSKGRYRLFSSESQVRVRWISKLQSMGLSLSEIQSIVLSRDAQPTARLASSELLRVYSLKLEEIRKRIAEYQTLESELESSVAFLRTCQEACDNQVAVSGCAQCERHQEETLRVPELVVGAQTGMGAENAQSS